MAKKIKPEDKVSRDVRHFLKMMGCSVYSTEQGYRRERGGTRQTPGIPDLLVFNHSDSAVPFFFIEVKAPGGKLRESQEVFQAECERTNIPYIVAYDVRDVYDFLETFGDIVSA